MTTRPVGENRLVSSNVVTRLVLSALAVLFCYAFQWMWLRSLTCSWNLAMDSWFGVHLQRVAADMVVYRGGTYRYAIACTMVDAYCGTIPLIWNLRKSVARNLGVAAALAVALFLFNVARLSFSDVLFAQGLSWNWAHNVVSGVSYFILWEWILSRRMLRKTVPD